MTTPNRTQVINAIRGLEETLRETRKQADSEVEHFQQEKHRLIQMRTEADEQVRDIKLQAENAIAQLRQHLARTQREYRRELEMLRRAWLGIEEPRPTTIDAAPDSTEAQLGEAAKESDGQPPKEENDKLS